METGEIPATFAVEAGDEETRNPGPELIFKLYTKFVEVLIDVVLRIPMELHCGR